jgi:hypothetical protein
MIDDFLSSGYNSFLSVDGASGNLPSLDTTGQSGVVYNPVLQVTNPESIDGGDMIKRVTTAPGLLEGGIQTALEGRRVVINNNGITAFNDDEENFFNMNTTNNGAALSLTRSATASASTELLRLIDQHPSRTTAVFTNTGDKPTADLVAITNEAPIGDIRYLLHVRHAGGEDVSSLIYAQCNNNVETLSGPLAVFLQNSASDVPAAQFTTDSGVSEFTTIHVNNSASDGAIQAIQNSVTSTNFYRIMEFKASTAATLALWVANNVNPNGSLSGNAGDICLSSNGNIYRCTGTTNWTAM